MLAEVWGGDRDAHAAEPAARARALRQLRRRPVRGRPDGRSIRRLLRRARGALDALAHHRRAARAAEPRARPRAQAAPARRGRSRATSATSPGPSTRSSRATPTSTCACSAHGSPSTSSTTTDRWTTASTAATRPTGSWCRGRSPRRRRRRRPTSRWSRRSRCRTTSRRCGGNRRRMPRPGAVRVREELLAHLADGPRGRRVRRRARVPVRPALSTPHWTRRRRIPAESCRRRLPISEVRPARASAASRLTRMPEYRAHFDFDIRFANGGGLTGTGFRLDLPSADRSSDAICGCCSSTSRADARRRGRAPRPAHRRGAAPRQPRAWRSRAARPAPPRRRPQPPDPRRARHLPGPAGTDDHAAPHARGLPREVRARAPSSRWTSSR